MANLFFYGILFFIGKDSATFLHCLRQNYYCIKTLFMLYSKLFGVFLMPDNPAPSALDRSVIVEQI